VRPWKQKSHQFLFFTLILFQNYFKDSWNTFDFITVVGSIIDATKMVPTSSNSFSPPPT
jgi:hypothetical protein